MRKISSLCLFLLAVGLVAGAVADSATGRVVVSFEPGQKIAVDKNAGEISTGLAEVDAVLHRHGTVTFEQLFGPMLHKFDDPETRADLARHYIAVTADKSAGNALAADLGSLGVVEEADIDRPFRHAGTAYVPDDMGSQWHLRNTALGGGDIRALGGWAESLGDSNVVVAVLDSGIDWHHPDLGGPHPDKVNGALWTNWTEYYGTAGVDDDGNGYIDDIRGWDYVNVSSGQVMPGEDYGPPDNDPMDFNGHGTNCAGCVSPITDNSIGVAAAAPGCKVMAIRIGWMTPDGNGVAYVSYMAQGFVYAVANGADIINLSYGTGYSSAFNSAINSAINNGLIICVAAGNDNTDVADYLQGRSEDEILTVAATNSDDGKADFSNYGTWIDVSAPGVGIYTTAYAWQSGQSTYTSTQGTSFASPIAAGVCALIWSAHPEMTNSEVAALVQSTCDDIDDVNPGYGGQLGHGRINLLRALGDNEQLVPQEYLTMQDAINIATPGDVIKVLASETVVPFTVVGKDLVIEGGYDAGYASRDPLGTPTVVQGTPTGPAVDFWGDVTTATVVDGFQLQGGGGRTFANIPHSGKYGGGMMVNQVSPTLRNLMITGNTAGNASNLGLGGGIALYNSGAVLEDVTITGNSAMYGSGFFAYQGAPVLTRVTIADNPVILDNISYTPQGGGIHVLDADLTLTDVTVTGHLDTDLGGGVYAADYDGTVTVTWTGGEISGNTAKTFGGGIYASGGTIDLTGVAVTDNGKSAAATFMGGGGMYADGSAVYLDEVVFDTNISNSGSGVQLNACTAVQITSTVFTNHEAQLFGGTVYLASCAASTLENLTIADNYCPNGGAGIYATGTDVTVSNTISAFNTGSGASANGIHATGTATLTCNDVFGNEGLAYGGTIVDPTGTDGNVAVDPQFCDRGEGDYRVNPSGPCAPDQSGGCGLIGALEASCGSGGAVADPAVPVAFRVDQNFPNPFNPATTLRFAIPTAARTSVVIYDLKGRVVKTLVDAELEAATHVYQWRGRDDRGRSAAAGVYFYKVTSGDHQAVGRMALIK